MHDDESGLDRLAAAVSDLARSSRRTIAVAESLTGGMVATSLAAAEAASEWFRGSVVAYSSEVKHTLLGVPDGPVVSGDAARAMAHGVRRLLGADVAIAITGAGGPAPQDGQPPGTVYLAVDGGGDVRVMHRAFEGDPQKVCEASVNAALTELADHLRTSALTREGSRDVSLDQSDEEP